MNTRRVSNRPRSSGPASAPSAARESLQALGLAVLVHVLAFALLLLGTIQWSARDPIRPTPSFTLVDTAPFVERAAEQREREQQQAADEARAEQQAEQARRLLEERQAEEARRQRELEQQQQRDDERRRAEDERARLLEQQREAQLAREQEAEAERQRRAAEEAQEQARREAEQERLRELEELRRQREEAQQRREAEERRLAELSERREQEARERAAAEEAERLRLARERAQAADRRATLFEEYVATIQEQVTRNWRRPPTTEPGLRCAVRVIQIPGGEIIDQAITSPCNADELTQRSILSAVERTENLAYRGYEEVFQREIEFVFRYDG